MPEDMPDKMPEDMPDRMPEGMPDRMSDRMPEGMPDRVPEDMPEHIAEDMPGRMPEDMPVTKRIDVMVGITRSEVIFSKGYPAGLGICLDLYPPIFLMFLSLAGMRNGEMVKL